MKKATWLLENLQQLKMAGVTHSRAERPWLIWLLPFGGLLIIGAYRLLQHEKDSGTNLVLSSIHSGDQVG